MRTSFVHIGRRRTTNPNLVCLTMECHSRRKICISTRLAAISSSLSLKSALIVSHLMRLVRLMTDVYVWERWLQFELWFVVFVVGEWDVAMRCPNQIPNGGNSIERCGWRELFTKRYQCHYVPAMMFTERTNIYIFLPEKVRQPWQQEKQRNIIANDDRYHKEIRKWIVVWIVGRDVMCECVGCDVL